MIAFHKEVIGGQRFPSWECPDLSRPGMPRSFPAGNAQTFPGRERPDLSRPGMPRPFPAGNGQTFPGREWPELSRPGVPGTPRALPTKNLRGILTGRA